MNTNSIDSIFPICKSILGTAVWSRLIPRLGVASEPEAFPNALESVRADFSIPEFLPELARVELIRYKVFNADVPILEGREKYEVNPTLEVLNLSWKLSPLFIKERNISAVNPEPKDEWVIIWRGIPSGKIRIAAASKTELLAIKVAFEGLSSKEIAKSNNVSEEDIDVALLRAAKKGLLIAPRSRLRRDTRIFSEGEKAPDQFVTAKTFTIQWHITHACDLFCKHCYDRSKRSPLTLEQGIKILDDLYSFCKQRRVRGHVCFSGGNPFMYPQFAQLYRAAADHGFSTSILGNPVSRSQLKEIVDIQKPGYFQVSLEGLAEHNDAIRGKRFFKRVIEFLSVLADFKVSSAVMLTLTKENVDQILPLAEKLRGQTDYFTFNRLSQVGEGAQLQLPTPDKYISFLKEYVKASEKNPIMGFKDNLINIVLDQQGDALFDGCTGFGCGAAFNFIAVLPDGDAHACRKFPSLIGNVLKQGIAEVYDSEIAQKYRRGCSACDGCRLRAVCGGCLAIAQSHRLDISAEKDPYCFIKA
ncbi:thio(seleno)oxazole modification radical SAM maturase SbtM [Candidatus Omnitrophota bacterium]